MSAAWVDQAELWTCALHEAGHAVLASLYAMTCKEIVLNQPGSRAREGGAGGFCVIDEALETIDVSPFRFLVYAFGGGAAEKRATGRPSSRDWGDREQADSLARIMCESESSPRIAQLLDAAERVAYARMQDDTVWAWTEKVARALMQKRRLSGYQIQQLKPQGRRAAS